MKCFCVSNMNHRVLGMAELIPHRLLSSMTEVSLWTSFFMKHVQNKCLSDNFPSIKCGAQELFGDGAERLLLWDRIPLPHCKYLLHRCPHFSWPPLPHSIASKDKSSLLGTVRHVSGISQTNCPLSNFFTPLTPKRARSQKLRQMHLPVRRLVLHKVNPTSTQTRL